MTSSSFGERLAEHVAANTGEITDAWIDRLPGDPDLPLGELIDEIPELLCGLAASLTGGGTVAVERERKDYIRGHAELRRRQGYALQRVIDEFTRLDATLCEVMDELLSSSGDVSAREVHAVHGHLHRELGRMGVVASKLYRDAEARERRRLAERLTNFSRTLEHEIRGPLQTASAAVHMLKRRDVGGDPEEERDYVRVADEELERVTELLTEIRRLTLTEQTLAEETWAPAEQMILDVFDELEAMAETKEVDLRTSGVPEHAHVNVPRVRLAVRNLVANGIKYRDPGASESFVEVGLRRPPEGPPQIFVADNGLGVPEELREQIFEPGVRAHPGAGSGTGLGLAIVRELLEQRRGSVSVESAETGGTRFVLHLPTPLMRKAEPAS